MSQTYISNPPRPTTSQSFRKRKATDALWNDILKQCETSPSIIEVAKKYPNIHYDSIRKKYKKYTMGDSTAFISHIGQHRLIFSRDEEKKFASHLRTNRDQMGIILTRDYIISEAKKYFNTLHYRSDVRKHHRSFSNGWVIGFKSRHDFSTKTTYKGKNKRLKTEEQERELLGQAGEFILKVNEAVEKYGKKFVFNMDETPAQYMEIPRRGWGDKGIKQKLITNTHKGTKDKVTLLPTVSASGNKLPLAWINNAKTNNLFKKFSFPPTVKNFFSSKGWTNEATMLKYIEEIIVPYTNRQPCALLLDSHPPHWTPMVKQCAWWYDIELIQVPKGLTDLFQPLDVSFNSPFQLNRQREFTIASQTSCVDIEEKYKIIDRAAKAYDSVSKEAVLSGWKPILF
jgi:hypothetical protein